jgi:hypothetical protein
VKREREIKRDRELGEGRRERVKERIHISLGPNYIFFNLKRKGERDFHIFFT